MGLEICGTKEHHDDNNVVAKRLRLQLASYENPPRTFVKN